MATRAQIAAQIQPVQKALSRATSLYEIADTRGAVVRFIDDNPDAEYTLTAAQKQALAAKFDELIATVKATVAGW